MATTETGTGMVKEAYGAIRNKPFNFEHKVFDNLDDAKTNGDWSDGSILALLNKTELNTAKATMYAKAVDEFKPAKDEPQVVYRNLLAQYALLKMPADVAQNQAKTIMEAAGYTPDQYIK